SAGGNGPVLGTDMSDEGVVDDHGEVARHLQLVAAADADAVDADERRLADLPQAVVHVLEGTEPLPVLAGLAEVVLAPRLEVGADAKRAAGAGDDDDPDLVVPGGVLAGARDLAQHPKIERVQDLGPVERDRRPRRRLLVDDRLEAESSGIAGRRAVRLAHSLHSAKCTWNGMPIPCASSPEAVNSGDRVPSLNASM